MRPERNWFELFSREWNAYGCLSFRFQLLCLPKSTDYVDSSFGWGSRKSWQRSFPLPKPKEEGGLDLRDSRCWNQALLSKILWNIHAKADTLWVKWVNSVYLRNQSVWEWQLRKENSSLLKQLAGIRNHIVASSGSVSAAIQLMSSWGSGTTLCATKAYEFCSSEGKGGRRYVYMKLIWSSSAETLLYSMAWSEGKIAH